MELIDDRTNGGASFFVRTIENLPLWVDDGSLEEAREDHVSVQYSKSGLRLLKCSEKYISEYKVWKGTKAICSYAFSNMENLKRLKLPDGLVLIGVRAFYECINLKEINIPNSVTYIGTWAFCGCRKLREIVLPESLEEIGGNPFANSRIKKIVSKSKHFKIDGNLLIEGDKVIAAFGEPRKIIIPEYITIIGESAFEGCENLTSIILPDGLIKIEGSAFYGCRNLRYVRIHKNILHISKYAFESIQINNVHIVCSADDDKGAIEKRFKELLPYRLQDSIFISEPISTTVTKEDLANSLRDGYGVLYSKDGTRLLKCRDYDIRNYKVWPSTRIICDRAFENCHKLNKIKLPPQLLVIGNASFASCESLTSQVIPNSVMEIGSCAFAYCSGLKAVKLHDGLTKIHNWAFFNCNCFGKVVELSESVEYIGKEAFTDCYYVKIPHTIKCVEEKAFDYFYFKRVYVTYTDDKDSVDLNRIRDMFPDKLFWNVIPICEKIHIDVEWLCGEGKINAVQYQWLQEYRKILEEYAPKRIIDWEMQIAYDMLLEYDEGDELPTPREIVEEWLF